MAALQRHGLVWLDEAGWQAVLQPDAGDPPWDEEALDCLRHWALRDLPLVVTRQPLHAPAEAVTLGLAAPLRWGRRRLFVGTRLQHLRRHGAFPQAAALSAALAPALHPRWHALCDALAAQGVDARVHGSFGWQLLCGEPCVRAGSDIDLLLPCRSAAQADAVAALLGQPGWGAPRLDGELLWPDDGAVAWREWAAWRAGRQRQLLVKRLHGAALESGAAWADAALPA